MYSNTFFTFPPLFKCHYKPANFKLFSFLIFPITHMYVYVGYIIRLASAFQVGTQMFLNNFAVHVKESDNNKQTFSLSVLWD